MQVKADGIHLPQFMLPKLPWIRKKHPKWIITTATHDFKSVKLASSLKSDYILISPIFKTASHPNTKPKSLYGLSLYKKISKNICPLGGINQMNIKLLSGLVSKKELKKYIKITLAGSVNPTYNKFKLSN